MPQIRARLEDLQYYLELTVRKDNKRGRYRAVFLLCVFLYSTSDVNGRNKTSRNYKACLAVLIFKVIPANELDHGKGDTIEEKFPTSGHRYIRAQENLVRVSDIIISLIIIIMMIIIYM